MKGIKQTISSFLSTKIIIQAALVGLFSGLVVIFFKFCINELFSFIQNFISHLTLIQKIIIFPMITTLGGLVSGILVYKFAPETKGSGIPFVKMVMARMGNITRARSVVVKFLAGLVGIGSGLSLGREGPSVQLGAGCGAFVSKFFKLKGAMQEKLIAAGAGSAIGATFNAPIAGTLFVFEELTTKFNVNLLFTVLVATVIASGVARYFMGNNPSFDIPIITGELDFKGLIVCAVLGVVSGILGVLFAKVIYFNNELFEKLKIIPCWLKPAISGLGVGLIGLFIPQVLGSGNLAVDSLFANNFPLVLVVVIFLAKFLVTPFCFGSGAAGGIFLPMLMLGAFLGYIVASIFNIFGFEVNPIIIAIIGMGAFLSAVARTPITAIVMVFEMTAGYKFILPIMLSAAIADLVAQKFNHKPIYSKLIVNQLEHYETKESSKLKVVDCMSSDVIKFPVDMKIEEVILKVKDYSYSSFPIVDKNNKLMGLINKSDIEDVILYNVDKEQEISLIMNIEPITINEDESLCIAYYRLHINNVNLLVVTDKKQNVIGVVTRSDIYN
ncbi:MAG: chloride channel protein [Candidatus Gastranaerophilales bacterium]|nr:chloride channel protein [Candidatus Gastranaerophilales bacterium]